MEQLASQAQDLRARLAIDQQDLQKQDQQITAVTEKADALIHYEELASRVQIECAVLETRLEAEDKIKSSLQAKVKVEDR